jgi:hypothetical protein
MKPPIELPTTVTRSTPSASQTPSTSRAYPRIDNPCSGIGDAPKPGRSSETTRWESMNAGMLSRKICQFDDQPCRNSSASSPPPVSSTFTR